MIALVSAPTNLGLRPPVPGGVPGTSKAPEALREAGLFDRFLSMGAADAGVVLPGGYVDDDDTRPTGQVRNQAAIIDHAQRLARRLDTLITAGQAPLVIGGDCSLLLGAGLVTTSREKHGLVHVDGHTDFRHPGNSDACASLAGEDLAAAVGKHWAALSNIAGRGPYFDAGATVHVGCRDDDEYIAEARSVLALVVPAREVIDGGGTSAAVAAAGAADNGGGYWLQVDVDVLDPSWMPAVDSPDPGGLDPDRLVELLQGLAPRAVGASITVFDPDLDPDGRYALLLSNILVAGLRSLGTGLT